MAINLTTKYSPKVLERFNKKSFTSGAASSDYTFEGVKSLKIYSVDTVPLGNYTRSGSARYGSPEDLSDTTQELTMGQDKAFTYIIDKGDNDEQLNIKNANRALQREIDERIVPYLDKYRFEKWCKDAGSRVTDAGVAIGKNNITSTIMDCTEKLDEAYTPDTGRTLFISTSMYKLLKQNPDFLENNGLAEKPLIKGIVGEIDGMQVVKVPNSYFPAGVHWLIVHKSAVLAPAKLQDYKIHKDPPGINGSLTEGRIIHDAFVLGAKAGSVCVAVNNSYQIAKPTVTNDTTNSKVTMSSASGTNLWYTIDGSDPYFSDNAVKGTTNSVSVNYATLNSSNAKSIRAVAVPNTNTSLFRSESTSELVYA